LNIFYNFLFTIKNGSFFLVIFKWNTVIYLDHLYHFVKSMNLADVNLLDIYVFYYTVLILNKSCYKFCKEVENSQEKGLNAWLVLFS
jgi:hypothetical protein